MYLVVVALILKVGKCVLQLVWNLAFLLCVHLASIGKYVLQIELTQNVQSLFSVFVAVGGLTGPSDGRTGASGRTAMGLAVGPALRLYRIKSR